MHSNRYHYFILMLLLGLLLDFNVFIAFIKIFLKIIINSFINPIISKAFLCT